MAGGRFRAGVMSNELPERLYDRVQLLQNLLINVATGGVGSDHDFNVVRTELLSDGRLRDLAPSFLNSCRSTSQFWSFIQPKIPDYKGRRKYIYEAFGPVLTELEFGDGAPLDQDVEIALKRLGFAEIEQAWNKALHRRHSDPSGAITAARTMLESTCKHILDDYGIAYSDNVELTTLYSETAKQLNLAPSQHSEKAFKTILGNANQVVSQLASLRNQISDAHGQGRKAVRPLPRHSALAVNLAGAVTMFLVETWEDRKTS